MDFFLETLVTVSEQYDNRFHQHLKIFEDRHDGFLYDGMLDDHCWSILGETAQEKYKM